MTKVIEKLLEYEANGVPNIWHIDPRLEQISIFRNGSLILVHDGPIPGH